MVQGFQTPSGLHFTHNDFFFPLLLLWYISCGEKKCKGINIQKDSFPAKSRSQLSSTAVAGQGLHSGLDRPQAAASAVSCKYLILPGGSFSFEDWCLEEQSGKALAICFSLCARQDHPEVRWRNITPAPGPELRHWPRLHSETDNRPRRGQWERLAWTVNQIIWRVTSLQTHPSVPCPSIRPRE